MHFNMYHYELTIKDAVSNYIGFLKKELNNLGHKVDLISNYNSSQEKVITGGKKALKKAIKTHFTKRVNWFHYTGYYPLIHLIKYVKGFKIFDYHGVTPKELWPYKEGKELITKGIEYKEYAENADLIIAHSKSAYKELRSHLKNQKKHIILRKYQLGNFYRKLVDKKKYSRLGITKKDKIIIFVGRVSPNKCVPVLIKALKHVKHKNKKLIIIGKYDNEPYLTEYKRCVDIAVKDGTLDKILFLGQVSDEVLNDFYNLASVFVIPSRHEGFCIPVVEAMKTGTPVIGANVTALPETIGSAGLLFEPDNYKELARNINRVLNDAKLRKNLINKGFEQYQRKQLKNNDIKRVLRMIK